jgi:hypothetical protein
VLSDVSYTGHYFGTTFTYELNTLQTLSLGWFNLLTPLLMETWTAKVLITTQNAAPVAADNVATVHWTNTATGVLVLANDKDDD